MKQKSRGHFCRICGSSKPNEAFSGKGHRIMVCKACSKLPREEREAIEHEEEIYGFLNQSRISDKNISRLRELVESPNSEIAGMAALVLEIGIVTQHKKNRLKKLKIERPDLLAKLEETGLIMAHHNW